MAHPPQNRNAVDILFDENIEFGGPLNPNPAAPNANIQRDGLNSRAGGIVRMMGGALQHLRRYVNLTPDEINAFEARLQGNNPPPAVIVVPPQGQPAGAGNNPPPVVVVVPPQGQPAGAGNNPPAGQPGAVQEDGEVQEGEEEPEENPQGPNRQGGARRRGGRAAAPLVANVDWNPLINHLTSVGSMVLNCILLLIAMAFYFLPQKGPLLDGLVEGGGEGLGNSGKKSAQVFEGFFLRHCVMRTRNIGPLVRVGVYLDLPAHRRLYTHARDLLADRAMKLMKDRIRPFVDIFTHTTAVAGIKDIVGYCFTGLTFGVFDILWKIAGDNTTASEEVSELLTNYFNRAANGPVAVGGNMVDDALTVVFSAQERYVQPLYTLHVGFVSLVLAAQLLPFRVDYRPADDAGYKRLIHRCLFEFFQNFMIIYNIISDATGGPIAERFETQKFLHAYAAEVGCFKTSKAAKSNINDDISWFVNSYINRGLDYMRRHLSQLDFENIRLDDIFASVSVVDDDAKLLKARVDALESRLNGTTAASTSSRITQRDGPTTPANSAFGGNRGVFAN